MDKNLALAIAQGLNTQQSDTERKADARKARARANRRARDEAMRGLGLTKVRGSLGGTYWE